jgi:hypothetical protein
MYDEGLTCDDEGLICCEKWAKRGGLKSIFGNLKKYS